MSDRATLRTLLDNLGSDIVEVLAAPNGLDVAIGHPVIDDPEGPPPIDAGDLVLAVGTRPDTAGPLILRAGRAGAAGVVFRLSGRPSAEVLAAADRAGLALLGVVPAMAWSQLHTLLRSAAAASGGGGPEETGGAIGDLFSLANAIAAMVGGPTTIEDPQSTVLAYSSLDEPIDEARRQTILGRRVPDEWLSRLHADGVFRRLWSEEKVVRVAYPDAVPELRPRIAIGIRAGGEVLGSIWVAEDQRPLDAAAEGALVEAARLAALHLIRARSGEDVERARRSSLLRAILDGQAVAPILAEALEVPIDAYVTVIGFRLPSAPATELTVTARRACRLLDLYCESTRRRGSAVAVGPVVYLLLADDSEPSSDRIEALVRDVLHSDMLPKATTAGIGSSLQGLTGVPASRTEGDQVLAVLETRAGLHSPAARIDDVRSHAIMMRLRELATSEPALLSGRLQALAGQDERGRGHHIDTLRAFLDAFGDVNEASAAVGVHPNTFRYRMRRLAEISGLDLDDPVERLVVHLQLYLTAP
jgi:DNA-binding PucR family transcriptional regulator